MRRVGRLRSSDPAWLGRYRIVGRLGSGGQGVVYLARDPHNRPVAVKTLHADLVDDERAAKRFVKELAAARSVAPFCTAQVLDAHIGHDQPFIVSEYIDGPSLKQAVADHGPRTGNELHRLATATATALAAIHEAGVVHRDFKPHNVLLGPDGPRVIDFGIARALDGTTTTTSRPIGTPAFMAPEQIAGQRVGPATDVFAWAGVIVFAATGRPPFGDDSIPAIMERILRREPDLRRLTGPLHGLIHHCLAKDPAHRPTVRRVLDQLLSAPQAAPRPGTTATRADAQRRADVQQAQAAAPSTARPGPPGQGSGHAPRRGTAPPVRPKPEVAAHTGARTEGQHAARTSASPASPGRNRRPVAPRVTGTASRRRRPRRRVSRRELIAGVAVIAVVPVLALSFWLHDQAPAGSRKGPGANKAQGGSPTAKLDLGNPVKSVAFGQVNDVPVVVSGNDRTVGVWDLATGKQLYKFAGHAHRVNSVAFGRLDGKPIALSGSEDNSVQVWDLTNGKQLNQFTGKAGPVASVATGQLDGKPVVLSGGVDSTLRVWDLDSGEQLEKLSGEAGPVTSVATGQLNGKTFALSGDKAGTLLARDLDDGEEIERITGKADSVDSVATGQLNGKPIAVVGGAKDGSVQIWDLTDGKQLYQLTGHTDQAKSVAFGRLGGKPVALSGSEDNSVQVWDLTNGKQLNKFTGHTDKVKSVAFGEFNGKPIALSGSEDGTVRLWSLGP